MFNDGDAYNIAKIYEQIENELIADMMRNLSRHRAEELKEGYDWEQWQVLQLQALEEYRKKNLKYIPQFESVEKRMAEAIRNANEQGGADAEKHILRALKRGAKATRQGSERFFQVNQDRVNALIQASLGENRSATTALLRKADDEYRKIIYKTQIQASTGSITYEKAVDLATKDFLTRGIQCIQYRNGAMHQISTYTEMAMRTSMKRAYMQGEGTKRLEWGITTVIVNHRNHACSKCLPFVGKVLIDDVYGGGSPFTQKDYPTLSSAMEAGLFHPNCKDGLSTYFEGITDKPKPMTKQEKAYATAYENVETTKNVAERKAEAFERLAEYALDPYDKRMYLAKAQEWRSKANQYSDMLNGMPPVYETAPPIQRPAIREEIPLNYTASWKGVHELPKDYLQIGTDKDYWGKEFHYVLEPKKRLEIPWDALPQSMQRHFYFHDFNRYGKPFYLQKKDLAGAVFDKSDKYFDRMSWYKDIRKDGYDFVGHCYIRKYQYPYDLYFFEKEGKMYMVIDEAEIERIIAPESIKAIKKRQDEVSKMLWDKGVHFKDLTARQGDDWVKAMKEFHTIVEADLPVTWVTEAEYDSIKGDVLLRGFAQQSHLRADITSGGMTTLQMAEQLVKGGVGDCFPSRGVYGDCIAYLSNNEKLAYEYATGYSSSDHGFIAEMKLKRDARGISYDEAKELFEALNGTELTAGADPYFSSQQRRLTNHVEVGKAMQLLGYDYIYEERGDGLPVNFYMILNRDAVVACPTKWIRNGDVRIGWKGYDKKKGY